ncbi:MAG: hypothetical protein MUF15_12780, partial [Acidobacteria bacterium]|nr:hypothetical protein [Acidobacteriota bacterium]
EDIGRYLLANIRGVHGVALERNLFEAIEAGRILGIDVNIGLEFSVGPRGKRFYYIYQFPLLANKNLFKEFIHENKKDLEIFIKGLSENQKNRTQSIFNLIDNFNTSYLSKINQGFPDEPLYNLEKLAHEEINLVIPIKHAAHIHLGELLFIKLKPVLFNRVMYLKARLKLSWKHYKAGLISRREYRDIEKKYRDTRKQYNELNAEQLRREYFSNPELQEYDSVFKDLNDIFDAVKDENLLNQHIKIIHPLIHGLTEAIQTILTNRRYIHYVEIYNMHDVIDSNPKELQLFTRFIDLLNSGNTQKLISFFKEHDITIESGLLEVMDKNKEMKIIPTCGSDSTGRTFYIPGMGFIYRKALSKRQYAGNYIKSHHILPHAVSQMIFHKGEPALTEKKELSSLPPTKNSSADENDIINMGKPIQTHMNEIGDEHYLNPVPLKRVWRYLNPFIKNTFYILVGFIPAFLQLNWQFALLWFTITTLRHILTDMISIRGLSPREWHLRSVYFANIAHSLFWTGFSVPLLAFVKMQFDLFYPLSKTGFMFEFAKFFLICIVNGTYLSTHNTLRGFDKITVRINFFRSLLAWPFAALFSPLGNLLNIPSIVQAKIWSDVVGGLIEGAGKFRLKLNIGKRDLQGLLPNICENTGKKYTAILDILYFFQVDPRTKNSLKAVLFNNHDVNQNKPNQPFVYFLELHNWFSEPGNYFKLINYILANYQPEQAIFLIDLVSNKYRDFHKWLLKHTPG